MSQQSLLYDWLFHAVSFRDKQNKFNIINKQKWIRRINISHFHCLQLQPCFLQPSSCQVQVQVQILFATCRLSCSGMDNVYSDPFTTNSIYQLKSSPGYSPACLFSRPHIVVMATICNNTYDLCTTYCRMQYINQLTPNTVLRPLNHLQYLSVHVIG